MVSLAVLKQVHAFSFRNILQFVYLASMACRSVQNTWRIPKWSGEIPPNMLNITYWMNRYAVVITVFAFAAAILATYLIEKPFANLIMGRPVFPFFAKKHLKPSIRLTKNASTKKSPLRSPLRLIRSPIPSIPMSRPRRPPQIHGANRKPTETIRIVIDKMCCKFKIEFLIFEKIEAFPCCTQDCTNKSSITH